MTSLEFIQATAKRILVVRGSIEHSLEHGATSLADHYRAEEQRLMALLDGYSDNHAILLSDGDYSDENLKHVMNPWKRQQQEA